MERSEIVNRPSGEFRQKGKSTTNWVAVSRAVTYTKKTWKKKNSRRRRLKILLALIVQNAKKSVGLRLVELQTSRVVYKLDVDPVDAFAFVLFLLVLENVLIKIVLQMLVGVVDAKLLETVTDKDNKRKKKNQVSEFRRVFLFSGTAAVPAFWDEISSPSVDRQSVCLSDLSFFQLLTRVSQSLLTYSCGQSLRIRICRALQSSRRAAFYQHLSWPGGHGSVAWRSSQTVSRKGTWP